ncbi:MAG: Ig-like domain-containing protein, partial [Myxococcaceae bacterium]
TVLADGRVLVSGGQNGAVEAVASVELYNPTTNQWATVGPLGTARRDHVQVLLTNGRVLSAGGQTLGATSLASAELFDPATLTWSSAGSLTQARQNAVAVLLANGLVLIAGGEVNGSGPLTSSETYDPATAVWSVGPSLSVARTGHTAALLTNGQVLVAGDDAGTRATEVFDVAPSTRPQLTQVGTPNGIVVTSIPLNVQGSGLRGVNAGSQGGFRDAPTDFPLFSLLPLGPGPRVRLTTRTYTSSQASMDIPAGLQPGPYILFVTASAATNGRVVQVRHNTAPLATGQSVTTPEDSPLGLILSASDPDGDPVTFTLTQNPAMGTLAGTAPNLTYTPAANWSGTESVRFTASDAYASSGEVSISITVTPINDAPVAQEASVQIREGASVDLVLLATDVEGDPLSFTIQSAPEHGSLAGTPPYLVYSAAAHYSGPDSIRFTANDGELDSSVATVAFDVVAPLHYRVGFACASGNSASAPVTYLIWVLAPFWMRRRSKG